MQTLCFQAATALDKDLLHTFIQRHISGAPIHWTEDFFDYCSQEEVDPAATYVERRQGTGQYWCFYCIYRIDRPELDADEWVGLVMQLAAELGVTLLTGDEELDPDTYIEITPDRKTTNVEVDFRAHDDAGELNVVGPYNFPFGHFATKAALTAAEEQILQEVFSSVTGPFPLASYRDGPVIDGDFGKNKKRFPQLKDYRYHYEIRPEGPQPWLSRKQKSALFIQRMQDFFDRTGKDVCLFPADYSVIRNIEGGSDTDEYCISITAAGQERITYKQRRNSWLR